MESEVSVRWVPLGRLAPVNELPGATPVGSLTCLLPPTSLAPSQDIFADLPHHFLQLQFLLWVLLPLGFLFIPGEACVTCPFHSLPSQDKHAEEVRKNKEMKEEASR